MNQWFEANIRGFENGVVASFGRAVAPNCPDLSRRQIALFLTLPGYEHGSISAEAQSPAVNRELGRPAVVAEYDDWSSLHALPCQ